MNAQKPSQSKKKTFSFYYISLLLNQISLFINTQLENVLKRQAAAFHQLKNTMYHSQDLPLAMSALKKTRLLKKDRDLLRI